MSTSTARRERTGTTTSPTQPTEASLRRRSRVPGLVLAWSPPGVRCDDRASLRDGRGRRGGPLQVGRGSASSWCIPDKKLSRAHFRLVPNEGNWLLEDLGSRNGTSLDGRLLTAPEPVEPGALVRAGGCLFALVDDLGPLSPPGDGDCFGISGRFHVAPMIHDLRVAARTGRHMLLEGETGAGKELSARAIHEVLRELGRRGTFTAENAACFAGDDDAVASLFGVESGVFTGVRQRTGALERAEGGTLFLDEYHNLPPRAQRSLLRFFEDGRLRRLGEETPRELDVRIICGTNLDVERAIERGELAHDLAARMHRIRVPSLRERRADIPSIFRAILDRTLDPDRAAQMLDHLRAEVVERLCLHDHRRGNVRELEEIAAVVAARLAEGERGDEALEATLDRLLGPPPTSGGDARPASGSTYEHHRAEIIDAYVEVGGNMSKLEAALCDRGIQVNRRWLAIYLERWGVRAVRRRRD